MEGRYVFCTTVIFICFFLLHACSRSQCIINISNVVNKADEVDNNAVLTIVDLAGAEREKRTGNQVLAFKISCSVLIKLVFSGFMHTRGC